MAKMYIHENCVLFLTMPQMTAKIQSFKIVKIIIRLYSMIQAWFKTKHAYVQLDRHYSYI